MQPSKTNYIGINVPTNINELSTSINGGFVVVVVVGDEL